MKCKCQCCKISPFKRMLKRMSAVKFSDVLGTANVIAKDNRPVHGTF